MDVVSPPCQAVRSLVHVGPCTLDDETAIVAENVGQLESV